MVNRKMPATQDELFTVAHGTQEEVEVVFDKPWMPEDKPAKYKVTAAGTFQGVWEKPSGDVQESEIMAYMESMGNGKTWVADEIVLEVE
jgi:hypothetical protein